MTFDLPGYGAAVPANGTRRPGEAGPPGDPPDPPDLRDARDPADLPDPRDPRDPPEPDAVIAGVVHAGSNPVSGAYVRLLDENGEFAAEVVTSATGRFRLFAPPGTWILRVLSGQGDGDVVITVDDGVNEVVLLVE